MKERPLIFSAASIPRLLDGTKTQTRRLVRPRDAEMLRFLGCEQGDDGPQESDIVVQWSQTGYAGPGWYAHCDADPQSGSHFLRCPHGAVGDRIWVREIWCQAVENGEYVDRALYKADGRDVFAADGYGGRRYRRDGTEASPWCSPLHMPRWASRITLELTDVRLQRLHEIAEDDAMAEGAVGTEWLTPVEVYRHVWLALHGPGSWAANPWVWALTFRRTP